MDSPFGMLLKELTLRTYHFRLNPNSKLHTGFFSGSHHCRHSIRQLAFCSLPISQTGVVIVTRILIGKPTVIQQEHIHTQMFGFLHQFHQYFLIKLETGIFPVIEQCHTIALTIFQLIVTRPCMNVPARLSCSFLAQCEDEFRSFENILRSQFIIRSIRIDGRNHPQITFVIDFKRKAEISGPTDSSQQHISLMLISRSVKAQLKERLNKHSSAATQLSIQNLFPELQLLCTHLYLFGPITTELCQEILFRREI